jgi:hypothetical protein
MVDLGLCAILVDRVRKSHRRRTDVLLECLVEAVWTSSRNNSNQPDPPQLRILRLRLLGTSPSTWRSFVDACAGGIQQLKVGTSFLTKKMAFQVEHTLRSSNFSNLQEFELESAYDLDEGRRQLNCAKTLLSALRHLPPLKTLRLAFLYNANRPRTSPRPILDFLECAATAASHCTSFATFLVRVKRPFVGPELPYDASFLLEVLLRSKSVERVELQGISFASSVGGQPSQLRREGHVADNDSVKSMFCGHAS